MLRSLLTYAKHDDSVAKLAEDAQESPQRAFVSASLRPYLLASLIDSDPERPALIVAGDDRAARDLAADLRAFLAPRPVRFYPARGMRYESHLAPPPHLVGLRIAALDSLLGTRPPCSSPPPWRSPRRSLIPTCARTASRSRRAACSTSTRPPTSSWPAATSASTRSRIAASSRSAATSSTSTPPPRSGRCAASCSTSRWSGSPGSRPSRSARSRRPSASRSRRRPSWRPSTASSPRSPPRRRRPSGRTSPRSSRWTASASCSTSCRRTRSWRSPPRRSSRPRCATTGRT